MFHRDLTGADLHAPSNYNVENNTGSTIPALKIVRLNGMGSVFPQVVIANPALYDNFGIVINEILTDESGLVASLGLYYNLNTSAWAPNTVLYSDINGNLSTSVLGKPIATVVKQNSTTGILFVSSVQGSDSGGVVAWDINGNAGVDPSINFLGTTDINGLSLRTNSTEGLHITSNQRVGIGTSIPNRHVEIKTHSEISATGLQIESFYVETSSMSPSNIYVVSLQDPSQYYIELVINGKTSDGVDRCSYRRTLTVFRENSSAQLLGDRWSSDYTEKSNSGFDISYFLSPTLITFKVKSTSAILTKWTGHIRLQVLF